MQRERFQISMTPTLTAKVDALARNLNMTRPDLLEVMVSFFFAYTNNKRRELKVWCGE